MFTYLYYWSLPEPLNLPTEQEEEIIEQDGLSGPLEKFQFIFNNDSKSFYMSQFDYIYWNSQSVKFQVVDQALEFWEEDSDDEELSTILIEFKSTPLISLDNQYENFNLWSKIQDYVHSRTLSVYSPFMVINKTNIPLIIGNKTKNQQLLRINHQESQYFRINEKENKLSVMTDGYDWSKPFDVTTVGLSGIV